MRTLLRFVFCLSALSLGVLNLQASDSPSDGADTGSPDGKTSSEQSADRTTSQGSASLSTPGSFLSRHVKFQALDGALRYLYADSAPHKVTSRALQYKISTRLQINLDNHGNSYFQARTETGTAYTLSWNSTGIGLNPAADRINAKTFLYGQRFARNWEVQVGGLEYDWGSGTEATYSDNDGYLEGYRVRYANTQVKWLPEKFSLTAGYVGDFAQLNVFSRFHRLGDNNYWQALVEKKLGEHGDASAEFDSLQAIRYTREALHWQKLHAYAFDDVQIEALTRASNDASFGGSLILTKSFDAPRRWKLGAQYVDLPRKMFVNGASQVLLNADMYGLGRHFGPVLRVAPVKNFELTVIGFHRLDNTPGVRNRAYVGIRYQFAGLANHALR